MGSRAPTTLIRLASQRTTSTVPAARRATCLRASTSSRRSSTTATVTKQDHDLPFARHPGSGSPDTFRPLSVDQLRVRSRAPKKTKPSPAIELEPRVWVPQLTRTGVLARKKGMTALWDAQGRRIPVTVVQLEEVQVTGVRTDPYYAVQIGCSTKQSLKTMNNAEIAQFTKRGLEPKQKVAEFMVEKDGLLPIGTRLSAAHFVPGQTVDVKGTTTGKGFAGVMKRHGFRGLRASHGVSVSHRSHGSTGQHQDPGRVFPGMKMAGHMGTTSRTVQNCLVMRIDTELDVIYLKGAIPGPTNSFVRVTDALKACIGKAKQRERKGIWSSSVSEESAGKKEGDGENATWESVIRKASENGSEVLTGIATLPFPAGTKEMVEDLKLPREIEALPKGRDPFVASSQ